jgi:hypothetical protein
LEKNGPSLGVDFKHNSNMFITREREKEREREFSLLPNYFIVCFIINQNQGFGDFFLKSDRIFDQKV